MREIKFRAWDKENKIMVGVDLIGEHVLKITDGEWESIDDFEVMQFTSLKDKNFKEIYKGDIVKVSYESNRLSIDDFEIIGEVIWSPEYLQFLVRTNIKHLKDGSVEFELYELCDTEYYSVLEIEVIGNIFQDGDLLRDSQSPDRNRIYENPELLEGEKHD